MKLVIIFILSILLLVSLEYNKIQYKENEKLETQLYKVRQSYLRHLNKCAFISRDQIQRIDGRRILLYHNIYH